MSDDNSTLRSASSPYGREIEQLLGAGFQAVLTGTSEPYRVLEILTELANKLKFQLVTWDVARGLYTNISTSAATVTNPFFDADEPHKYCNPNRALDAIPMMSEMDRMPKNVLIVFLNFEPYWEEPGVRQRFERLCQEKLLSNNAEKHPCVFLQHSTQVHPAVSSYIREVPFQLPNAAELDAVFDFIAASSAKTLECDPELRTSIVRSLQGLSSVEAEDTLALGTLKCQGFTEGILDVIESQKAAVIGKSDVLKYVPKSRIDGTELLQGYDDFLAFVRNKAVAYDPAARELLIDLPKGVVLVGIPGTGKSLCATLVARLLGRPLIMWDIGAMFGSLVGETEARLRDAIRTIEALSGAVVVIDEADKVLAGMAGGSGDSGVSSRVFGQLLSWLQSKEDESFVIVTMNRTEGIPAEFFRTGRFDAVFGVDSPDAPTRRSIMEAHLRKRGVDPESLQFSDADWAGLIDATDKMVGSDLEETVKYARATAFQRGGAVGGAVPTFEELMESATFVRQQIVAEIDSTGVAKIKKFVTERTRPVYKAKQKRVAAATGRPRPRTRGLGRPTDSK
jgi:hypothetical protein